MSILDYKKTANHITNWIKDYATKAGVKTLILGLSGGIDSALVALLCKRTGLPLLCVNMPCHSSNSAYERANKFASEFGLNLIKIDLSQAHESIYNQATENNFGLSPDFPDGSLRTPLAVGGLRSCLRAPTLSYYANATKGLIVGTGNRSEDNITRYFQKYGDGCVDVSPISDLFKNEVYELFAYLASTMHWKKYSIDISQETRDQIIDAMPQGAIEIYNAKPTADLWGPDAGQEDEKELGITYDEIEWADREDMRTKLVGHYIKNDNDETKYNYTGIIFSNDDPAKHPEFYRYTNRQKEVICKLHQLEKISRHKINTNLPCCKIRNVDGLVK
jgi:NAD+ synthase